MILFFGIFFAMLPLTTMPYDSGQWESKSPIIGVLFLFLLCGYFICIAFRAYFRSVFTLKEKLRNISFDHCKWPCQNAGHPGCDIIFVFEVLVPNMLELEDFQLTI